MSIANRRNSRSYGLKLTKAGGIYIIITLLLGFAAVNTGNNLLYLMVSALLGFMAISGLMGQRNLKRLKVTLLPDSDLFAGLPAQVHIRLENARKYLPAFLIEIAIGEDSTLLPVLLPGQSERVSLSITIPLRGYQQLTGVWVKSRFPVNFFIRSSRLPDPDQVLVYPTPHSGHSISGSQMAMRRQQRNIARPGQDGEVRNIDNYHPSDNYKDIHWKHSARQAELKVKRYQQLGGESVMLKLEDFNGSLESQLSQCTFAVEQLIRHANAVGLQLGDLSFPPQPGRQQRNRLLKELALYGHR